MNRIKYSLFLLILPLATSVLAQQKPALSWKDVSNWNFIRSNTYSLSPNGQWLSWAKGPTEGDLQTVIRNVSDTSSFSYPIGATASGVVYSKDSKYAAFKVSAKDAEVKAVKKTMKPLYDQLVLVSLPGNQKTTFEKIKAFSFSADNPEWMAIHFIAGEQASKDKDAPKGTDLLLYQLNTKKSFNLGNVSEYSFNKSGTVLAYIIDANGQNGNGIFIRDMKTGLITAIENDKANYKSINWNENGDAFALLKSNKNEKYKEAIFTVIGINKISGELSNKISFSGLTAKNFPKAMGISGNGTPYWSEDQTTLFFGISAQEKKADSIDKDKSGNNVSKAVAANKADTTRKSKLDSAGKSKSDKSLAKADIEKPDMIIWNWQDKRLQSAQQTQETRDKNYSYLSAYRIADQKFSQLADSTLKTVIMAPKNGYAIGYDNSNYELMGNLDGQGYTDIYLIDLKTGLRKRIFEKFYTEGQDLLTLAPNGKWASFSKDGAFYSLNLETGQQYNLTQNIKASFVDELDDHNVLKPATSNFG